MTVPRLPIIKAIDRKTTMQLRKVDNRAGYTLIELIAVLVIVGILATVALKSLTAINQTSRYEETKQELDRLAWAVAGNPNLVSGGVRTDYGYVGDVGSLPPNLDALVTNPGGWASWDGPYLTDAHSFDGSTTEFARDAWGAPYAYSGGVTIVSSGGPSALSRRIAQSEDDLLYNRVSAVVVDLDFTPPGTVYRDSVRLALRCPNGTGGWTTALRTPLADGYARFDSIPIGLHELRLIYLPTGDTLTRLANVDPGESYHAQMQYFADVWGVDSSVGGATELEFVADSDTLTTGNCNRLVFWIVNNTGGAVVVSSLTTTWGTPTAYYPRVLWNGAVVRSGSPALGSGDTANFTSARTVNAGQSVRIELRDFTRNSNGGGPPVNVIGAAFTATFSDGSTMSFTADLCD